jgi:hypothetical protein
MQATNQAVPDQNTGWNSVRFRKKTIYNIGGNVTNLALYFAQFRRLGDPHH